jgi:transcriptional regulator with XRE-family HTH domain/anti-sigma regulatory factor (Ser/Thr protein kinase)
MAGSPVVSLAERLKQRRQELGISQSQAARELDVARTAYRLWEMEAARPAPDRWRLIASWLGVSVTTMLLADELVSEGEAAMADVAARDFGRTGRDWDRAGAGKTGSFFAQAQALIADGATSGALSSEQAEQLRFVVERIEQENIEMAQSLPWEEAEFRKTLPATVLAPRVARQALRVVAEGVGDERLAVAELLLTELVTNSVKYGPSGPGARIGIFIEVKRDLLRAEVSDRSTQSATPRQPGANGGFGLLLLDSLADAWGSRRDGAANVTWFDLALPLPGTSS